MTTADAKRKHRPWWQETILLLVIAVALALLIKTFFVQAFYIPSPSMVPGLVKNDQSGVPDSWTTYLLSADANPFDPNAKATKLENFRQIYVIFEGKDAVYSLTLVGPTKTVAIKGGCSTYFCFKPAPLTMQRSLRLVNFWRGFLISRRLFNAVGG